ncbi:hypothetical protein [Aminobacter sp. AP02]|uniref:hypothetical protein n=1 Tax=Aminobacter sp. AP02 TaxID=2135737 RepID=UPI000D7A51B0|nr:hypothetical protein [Aminobacter sp. AP02]PWK66514.1 hypothetical protein C8K44_114147 [Aminobacter sp. AP02]
MPYTRKALLSVMGALEAATGVVLMAVPALLVELLLGVPPGTTAGLIASRIASAALLALGVACWLARHDADCPAARGLVAGMLIYNVVVAAILFLAWTHFGLSGVALWPAVLAHVGLAGWCIHSQWKGI